MRKDNVLFGGIKPETVLGIWIVDRAFRDHKEVFVLTSVKDGIHGSMSYHGAGFAFDCRLPIGKIGQLVARIRRDLGAEYDVVVETDHLHVEFDVRRQGRLHRER